MRKSENPQHIADKIGMPLDQWAGNCYAVACQILKAGIVKGDVRYGHFLGDIHPDSEEFGGRGFTHHGWIERKSTIYDPTRWAFGLDEPYIWIGPKTDPDYDFGSNAVRKAFMSPAPAFVADQKNWEVPERLLPFVHLMLEGEMHGSIISVQQIGWLSSLPLDMLGNMAEPVYTWVVDIVKFPGFIPLDNRQLILDR